MPGKVLAQAGGRSVLEWVVQAVAATKGVTGVCVAIPEGDVHEPVVEEARRLGTEVARGSEHDVLSRFVVAARQVGADVIMRVTTDCPFSDPDINAEVLSLLTKSDADYACNNEPFGYPHGLDCEVFTLNALLTADRCATSAFDREHVTPWLKRAPDVKRRYLIGPGGPPASWRWTVDHPEDFEFLQTVAQAVGNSLNDHKAVTAYLRAHPNLHDINHRHRQR